MKFKSTRMATLSALIMVLLAAPANAALTTYVELVDETTSTPIMGGSTASGHVGQVEVYEYHHLMEVPGGMTAVTHQTVIMTMPLDDPSIPVLLQKMDLSQPLAITFHFWRPDSGGVNVEYLTVTLTNARIASFEPLSPNNLIPENQILPGTARLRLSYGTMDVLNVGAALNYTLTN